MAALLALVAAPVLAGPDEDRRAQTGIRLFRSLLSADVGLAERTGADGKLLLVLFYTSDRERAVSLARVLHGQGAAGPEPVRDLPVRIELTQDPGFGGAAAPSPAGIFLAQAPDPAALRAIVRYGIERGVVVYSPFEGHVEKGVLGGLSVEAQVRPYVNRETLASSRITLKPFFLKVTKVYP